ncbi:hypothetical protein [Gluconobacter wancherniae]|nr:hypothetical protein [Gluconobacter wancherniae]GBD57197.1 hypothetical protein NBRC103581_01783 [Gluconobacter wancherniae NBRC 103581]
MFFTQTRSPRLPGRPVPATVLNNMALSIRSLLAPSRTGTLVLGTLLLAPALTGCKLIDQRTFDPNAGKPPKPYIPPTPPGPAPKAPFLQIEAGTPASEYGPIVEKAAKAALARKPNVLFIVQGYAPMQPDPAAQAQTLSDLTKQQIAPIADRIAAAGAQPIQIEIHATTDPSIQHARVRVDVR